MSSSNEHVTPQMILRALRGAKHPDSSRFIHDPTEQEVMFSGIISLQALADDLNASISNRYVLEGLSLSYPKDALLRKVLYETEVEEGE